MQPSLRSNSLWMIAASGFSQMFGFISSIILARLLYPEAFGIIATVAIYNGVIGHFVGGGLGDALIKKRQVDSKDYDFAFSFQALFCLIAFILIFTLAPLLSSVHNLPELRQALPLAAIAFLLRPFTNIASVKLKVENGFNKLAKINTARSIFTGCLAISFALSGFGFYALIVSGLISSTVFIPILLKSTKWLPKPEFSIKKGKQLLSTGAGFTLNTVAGYINDQLPRYAASIALGSHFLGIYSRAESLCRMPVDLLVQSVSQPTFRKMATLNRQHQLQLVYRSTHLLLIYIGPIFVAMALFAEDVVPIVYGEPWRQAGEIISIIAPFFITVLLQRPIYLLMVTNSLLDKVVKNSIEIIIISLVFLFFLWDQSISNLIYFIIFKLIYSLLRKYWISYKKRLINLSEYLNQVTPAIGFVACYAILLGGVSWILDTTGAWNSYPVITLLEMILVSFILLILNWLLYPSRKVRSEANKILTFTQNRIKQVYFRSI